MHLVEFRPKDSEWNDGVQADIIGMLEDWLTLAKQGEFHAVAICAVNKDYSVSTNVTQHNAHPTLVGAVAILQTRLLNLVPAVPVE